jgi:hypothetical protein
MCSTIISQSLIYRNTNHKLQQFIVHGSEAVTESSRFDHIMSLTTDVHIPETIQL